MIRKMTFTAALLASAVSFGAEISRLGDGPGADRDMDDSSRVSSPYWDRSRDNLPAADIRAVPPARAAQVETRWIYMQSKSDLGLAVRMAGLQQRMQPEYKDAVAAEETAYDQMQAARDAALAGLRENASYQASTELHSTLTEQLHDMHDTPKPDMDRITATARLRMSYVSDNRKLESDTLSRDTTYQEARKNYVAAAKRVSDMRLAQAFAIATDDSLISLRKQVAQSRIAFLTADAYLQESYAARNIALDYAEYSRYLERYRPYGGHYYTAGYRPGYYQAYPWVRRY